MKKQYKVNWNDIKLETSTYEANEFMEYDEVRCLLKYDTEKYRMLSNKFYQSYHKYRFIPVNIFNLKKEKELIKSIIITHDYYDKYILKKEVHKL